MSAPSVRRLKDRNGRITPQAASQRSTTTRSPTSFSDKTLNSSALKKSLSGKENPRLNPRITGVAQKPTIRALPRLEKAALVGQGNGDGEVRVRWSASSVARGRSPSPSEFVRGFRDSRGSKVLADRGRESMDRVASSAGKKRVGVNGIRATRGSKEIDEFGTNLEKKNEVFEGEGKNLGSNLIKSIEINDKRCEHSGFKLQNGIKVDEEYEKKSQFVPESDGKVENTVNGADLCLKEKPLSKDRTLGDLEEKRLTGAGKGGGCVDVKYPSKLHEKLAFLEGKVKRIASDIKKTKEMLDMNNPDTSKVILSDIHDKISGIEKAMQHVVSDSDGSRVGQLKSDGNDNIESKKVDRSLVKGLNSEELEARLFPHHKLLRDRTSLKVSLAGSQRHECANDAESDSEMKLEEKREEKPLSPIEENPIALEFLASLNKDQTKFTMRHLPGGMEFCEVQEVDDAATSGAQDSSNILNMKQDVESLLATDERLDDFDDQENREAIIVGEETDDACIYQLNEIGHRNSTGGWFVSEGESVLLAHDDGSCSFYDIANCEEKAIYKPPAQVPLDIWRDCWIIRAPGADGCSEKYVVAASAGTIMDSGFCSWDFYNKDVRAFYIENGGTTTSRTILGPLSNNTMCRRNAFSNVLVPETRQWWYKPCGPLIISTATSQRVVKIHDIRDGEQIMKWEVQKPVLTMDYSSPLQWRNRGKAVVAKAEAISLWDVNSLNPQALLSVPLSGRKISALHVINTDAELGGGVRQRVTSSEADGNDGVFCTADSINILDFRHPSGVGLKIPKIGASVQSVFTRGDSVYAACTNVRSAGKKQSCSLLQHFSLRKQRLVSSYSLPESNVHTQYSAMTQVWGNSNLVMGVCGLGLFVFDYLNDDGLQSFAVDYGSPQKAREIIGPDDMYSPTFDYLASRVLIISRDRPALWRQLP